MVRKISRGSIYELLTSVDLESLAILDISH